MQIKANITINDIARIAGISKRTVSRVINGSGSVGQATRERIESVIREHNFLPDKQARGLASKRSYLLGVIYDNPDALYIDQVQRGVVGVCTKLGYELVVHPCHWKADDFIQDCENFIKRSGVDGVLILPPVSESNDLANVLRSSAFPYVRIASSELDEPGHIVVSRDRMAMEEIAKHLIELEHTSIKMISGPMQFRSSVERMEGFMNALSNNGSAISSDDVIEGQNTYESGIECAKKLLSTTPLPTAIFANNDEMAAGVIRVANDLGIAIPQQLSVAGFDDNLFASRIIPSLTTIKRPVEEMASYAANKLIHTINPHHKADEAYSAVKPYLIKRESTAQCPSSVK